MLDERVKDALNAVQFERDCVFVCCTEQLGGARGEHRRGIYWDLLLKVVCRNV